MADQKTPEGRDYHSDVRNVPDAGGMEKTAGKVPADHSEQKVTRSTEGSVERTTNDERKS